MGVCMRKPNFFIVGEPRCGTSALTDFLHQHPDIFMANPREPNYFCQDILQEGFRFHKKNNSMHIFRLYFPTPTEKSYMELFKDAHSQVKGESSAIYLYSKTAAQNIHDFNPEAKIIILIRNPVDFLYSFHSHLVSISEENEGNFKKALSLESQRKQGKQIPKRVLASSELYYSERVKFYDHIKRFLEVFNKKQIKIILYDDFKNNNAGIYKKILQFLGVGDFQPKFGVRNASRQVRFRWVKYFMESPFIWKGVKFILPKSVFGYMKKFFYQIVRKHKAPQAMDQMLRKDLMKQYKPEVEALSKLLKRDLVTLWGYDKV